MQETVVLVGAGSAVFTRGLVADIIRLGWETDLRLVDISPEALSVAEGLTGKMIEAKSAPIRLSASTELRDMLPGASVVITTIAVGGRSAWEDDVLIPRKYGIYQPVGDSVMPGGTSRSLRMIPAMVDIAKAVVELAADALFFNYSNPMATICRAVRKATGATMVGLCHGVPGVARYLASALGVASDDIAYTAVGMNHLTWFTELRVQGQDAMPRLHEIAREKLKGRATDAADAEDNPFSWHLFELFGAFPAVLDRHVSEFFTQFFADGQYYGKTLGVDAFSFEATIERGNEIFEEMRQDALSDQPLRDDYFEQFSGEHEQVTEMIESIRQDAGRIYSANLPNRGQVPNLPEDAIVECPAIADGSGLRPIIQPPLPAAVVGTLATRMACVETVVEAALEGSREKLIQALVLDGAVDSLETATRLADELLAAQAKHLPQFETMPKPT